MRRVQAGTRRCAAGGVARGRSGNQSVPSSRGLSRSQNSRCTTSVQIEDRDWSGHYALLHEAAAAGGDNDEHEEYEESESLHREEVRVGRVDISLNLTQKF